MPSIRSAASTALSGMQAAQVQLDASASNIANADTPGYRRRVVQQTPAVDGGVTSTVQRTPQSGEALETDVVAQLQAKNAFLANLQVFKTSDALAGALLDKRA